MNTWFHLKITTVHELEEHICDFLYQFDISGIQIQDYQDVEEFEQFKPSWVVLDKNDFLYHEEVFIATYILNDEKGSVAVQKIKLYLETLDHTTCEICLLENEDWANEWKKYYKPLEVGTKFLIKPSWAENVSTARKVIHMDPGMAFGTGQHETTVLCMELLEDLDLKDKKVLDIGCGSGILSLAAAHLGADDIMAIDIDELAVEATRNNIHENGLENKICVQSGDLTKGLDLKKYDIIIANILFQIIQNLIPEIPEYTHNKSQIVISGILEDQEERIRESLDEMGLYVVHKKQRKEWVALVATYR